MSTVLVFGANGFVGPYLAREFSAHGYRIVASDMVDSPKDVLECDSYRMCNLLDAGDAASMVSDVRPDVIVNLAAVSSVGQSWRTPQMAIEVNTIGSLNVLEAAKMQEAPPKILIVGSSEEYAPSDEPLSENSPLAADNPYGISKMAQERFAEIYADCFDLPVYRVRSFNHTGIGQPNTFVLPSFCEQVAEIARSGKPGAMKVGNLGVKRDFSDVRDVVRAYRLVVESDYVGEVFNIGSGKAPSLEELLQTVIVGCGQEVAVEIDPALLRFSDNPVICCNYAKIKSLIDWEPKIRIEQTLSEMVLYCKEHAS